MYVGRCFACHGMVSTLCICVSISLRLKTLPIFIWSLSSSLCIVCSYITRIYLWLSISRGLAPRAALVTPRVRLRAQHLYLADRDACGALYQGQIWFQWRLHPWKHHSKLPNNFSAFKCSDTVCPLSCVRLSLPSESPFVSSFIL